ncbi:hypothetical protein [Cognatishimia sp. F0-27]|uniref:hypothetical protein n=1 Tax=Cognatishimia sp. F0-27 TaxID=2816855 RepID=UPI001D0C0CBC|nr:hypothetical protein [Cognatishimia sp. F0-27]MCC1494248.1 hypothetical protein [Cognatishimia sp. F0-27]
MRIGAAARLAGIALLLALAARPAAALSCRTPDPVRDFLAAAAAEEIWMVVTGTLRFNTSALPRSHSGAAAARQTDIPATLRGLGLGPKGFDRPFARAVTLRVLCFGPWCGAPEDGGRYLAFVKREAGADIVFASPCGANLHATPSRATLAAITACFTGDACAPAR